MAFDVRLNSQLRQTIADRIKADIDAYSVELYNQQKRREHLGASEVGEMCLRRLVYSFRWMHRQQFDGRMLRLFNRGHREEERLITYLKGILAEVWASEEGGKQYSIEPTHGHFKGSLDSVLRLPTRYESEYGVLPAFLGEFKTHNQKSFDALRKADRTGKPGGVRASKPKHFKQMCVYGEAMEFRYGVYFAVNKNDDDIFVEVVELDWQLGRKLRHETAGEVIHASRLPPKIAATAAYMECKFCPMAGVCHHGADIDRNCRSCRNSIPCADGSWSCSRWEILIPADKIPLGCSDWTVFE